MWGRLEVWLWFVRSFSPTAEVVLVVEFDRMVAAAVVVMRLRSVSGAESGVLLRSAASR